MYITMGQVESPTGDILAWPKLAAAESFLAGRAQYFDAIRAGTKELISQATDFGTRRDTCAEYAVSYRDLLRDLQRKVEQSAGMDQQRAITALRTALAVDTVRVMLTDFRGQIREAILVGPTHPLRALWLAMWSQVAQHWIAALQNAPTDYVSSVRHGLVQRLVPLHVPAMLPLPDSRIFTPVDNLHPFWSLYAPIAESDTRGLLGEICAAFHLPEPAIGGTAISAEVLASGIARYLIQHPYVRTLSLNVFNPGRATTLAEALVTLQKHKAFADLRYDVRLFVPDPSAPSAGEAIKQLCIPDSTVCTDAVDAFSASRGNHLFPKLRLSVHAIRDFSAKPDPYRAHLSLLFDLFPAADIGARTCHVSKRDSPCAWPPPGFCDPFPRRRPWDVLAASTSSWCAISTSRG
jgi:hypothetical protein